MLTLITITIYIVAIIVGFSIVAFVSPAFKYGFHSLFGNTKKSIVANTQKQLPAKSETYEDTLEQQTEIDEWLYRPVLSDEAFEKIKEAVINVSSERSLYADLLLINVIKNGNRFTCEQIGHICKLYFTRWSIDGQENKYKVYLHIEKLCHYVITAKAEAQETIAKIING